MCARITKNLFGMGLLSHNLLHRITKGLKNNIKCGVFHHEPERSHRVSLRALRDMKPGLLKYARAFLLAKEEVG